MRAAPAGAGQISPRPIRDSFSTPKVSRQRKPLQCCPARELVGRGYEKIKSFVLTHFAWLPQRCGKCAVSPTMIWTRWLCRKNVSRERPTFAPSPRSCLQVIFPSRRRGSAAEAPIPSPLPMIAIINYYFLAAHEGRPFGKLLNQLIVMPTNDLSSLAA